MHEHDSARAARWQESTWIAHDLDFGTVWHHHESEGEPFPGVRGRFRVEFRARSVELESGELIVVPRGIEHRATWSNRA